MIYEIPGYVSDTAENIRLVLRIIYEEFIYSHNVLDSDLGGTMKKQLIIIPVVILLIVVSLSGCFEEKPVKTVKDYVLTLDDLPDGYELFEESFDDDGGLTPDDISCEEQYKASYWHNYSQDNNQTALIYPVISILILKFGNNDDASKVHQVNIQNNQSDYGALDITPKEIESIGDESIYKLSQGEYEYTSGFNVTYTYLRFRVRNIYVAFVIMGTPDLEIDYITFTFDLAKIVENRIRNSFS